MMKNNYAISMLTSKNDIWTYLRNVSKSFEISMNQLERKRTGCYFTDLNLTDVMMQELVATLDKREKNISEYTFLEPCVGLGNFVFSYLKAASTKIKTKEEAEKLINNIYVADINVSALEAYKNSLSMFVLDFWGIELSDKYFDTHIGKGLLIDVTKKDIEYVPLKNVFNVDFVNRGFDIVVTNPPYKNLKAERTQYTNDDEYEEDKKKYNAISKIIDNNFYYSKGGILNLYKLFVEEITEKYANENSYISLLIPASVLSDKSCLKLRTRILSNSSVISVKVIPEGSRYIDAQQALCALLISKGEKLDKISITKNYFVAPNEEIEVYLSDIMNENTGNAIFAISPEEYKVIRKLREFPVVKDLNFIINLRGELDLTIGKKYITNEKTGYALIRGRNIGYYNLIDMDKCNSVEKEFVKTTKKRQYIESDRIICQQISNMKKEHRVNFAYIPKGYVLGNSCNFISVKENNYGIDIYALLGLFNSQCINWLFKLTSSNNHINNYEIDCFPVPICSRYLKEISEKVKEYIYTNKKCLIDEIEKLVLLAYGLLEENREK